MKKDLSKNQVTYFVEETHDKVIVHEFIKTRPEITIGISSTWWMLVLSLVGGLAFLLLQSGIIVVGPKENTSVETISTGANLGIGSEWIDCGFMFPNSDSELITKKEIVELAELYGLAETDVIQYAINEIYARNHYYFTKAEWYDFYSQFEWYTGNLGAEDARSRFNSVEIENLSILTKLRKLYK